MTPSELYPGVVIRNNKYNRLLKFSYRGYGDCYVFKRIGESFESTDFLSTEDLLRYEVYPPTLENK